MSSHQEKLINTFVLLFPSVSTDPHAGNLGVETLDMASTQPEKRVRLCYYDFGQAAELKQHQADGILAILEAIIDADVDRSVVAFQQMGVLKDGADLYVVRTKVAENYRTGKIKAKNKKSLKRQVSHNNIVPANITANPGDQQPSVNDAQVMQYFTLPAEYAFVGRALTQMDGVGKSLDPDFDFVSASAPWFYEIKGADKYLKDEATKKLDELKSKILGAFSWHEMKAVATPTVPS
jgi:predicted unusual protein kinase regulating ubiquinone biosynthesis (AarF/ABC1/UbiB family)